MKQTTRAAALLLALALLLGACSGRKAPAADAPEKSLYRQGQELAAEIVETAGTPDYLRLLTGDQAVLDLLAQAVEGKDYTAPQTVYRLKVPEEAVEKIMGMSDAGELDGLPQGLQKRFWEKFFRGIPSQLNAMGGTSALAAASICAAEKTFVSTEVSEPLLYIYAYENGTPIAVTFLPGEDGAVSASGIFLFYDGLDAGSLGEYGAMLEPLGITVETIQ